MFSLLLWTLVALPAAAISLGRTRNQRRRGRPLALTALTLSLLQVAALAAGGTWTFLHVQQVKTLPSVSQPQQANPQQLNVGHCLAELPDGEKVPKVTVVPCTEEHEAEVVAVEDLGGFFDLWPGQSRLDTTLGERCRTAAPDAASAGTLMAWTPTETGWRTWDRTGFCLTSTP